LKDNRGENATRLNKIVKNKTAFSAVIASLILMLIAVAAGVVVYAYVMGWLGGAQQNSTSTGRLQVDSITASTSGSAIQIYVRNIGGVDLVLSKCYVQGTEVAVNGSSTTLPASLPVQSTACLQFSQSMIVGKFYSVEVVCTDGTTISTSVAAT